MDQRHCDNSGSFLLCLAIFVHRLAIVLRWTTEQYLPFVAPTTASVLRRSRALGSEAPASTTSTTTVRDGDMREMAHALSLPAPIDLPDNKQKDDDMCLSSEYFHIEANRLRTFTNWKVSFISANVLARYGFYYVGSDDTVKCHFCRVEIGLWEPQDDVIQEHLRWSPFCPLLKKRPTNNVPLNSNYLDAVPEPSYDTCGIHLRPDSYAENIDVRHHHHHILDRMSADSWTAPSDVSGGGHANRSGAADEAPQQHSGDPTPNAGDVVQQDRASMTASEWNNGVLNGENSQMRRPEYPNYAIEADRLKTYDEWPTSMKQKPKQLSDAGFFYTGKSDRVKCFSCGGGLKDWESDDEPFEQHAIWYSNCHYLQLMKGREFVERCLALKEAADAEKVGSGASSSSAMSTTSSHPSTSGISSASSSVMSTSPASSSGFNSPTPTTDDECTLRCSDRSKGGEGADDGEDDAGCGRKALSDGKICRICFVNEYNTAFMPCGHVVACAKCASSVSKCPLCQQPFINVLRLYLS